MIVKPHRQTAASAPQVFVPRESEIATPVMDLPPEPQIVIPVPIAEQAGPGAGLTGLAPIVKDFPGNVDTPDGAWHIGQWIIRKTGDKVTIEAGNVPPDAERTTGGFLVTIRGPESIIHIAIVSEPSRRDVPSTSEETAPEVPTPPPTDETAGAETLPAETKAEP
jgi:hypothetical protein